MKNSLKKITMLVALTLTVTSVFAGCKKTTSTENPSGAATTSNTSKEAKLKMYLLGDKPKDYDLVYGEVNKKLKDKVNATLDVQFIPWGDLNTKYPLLFSSGEDFDLIFTATGWAFYNQMATRNGFLELTPQLLEKYAPNSWKNEPKIAWDQAKVNGKIFMIPNDQNEYSANVIGVRGDLREKYGISEIKTQADLEKYYDAIIKNEKDIVPIVNGGGQNLQWPLELESNELSGVKGTTNEPLFVFNMKDTSGKILSMIETPQFKDYATKMKAYADKGYWSKNSISSKETRDDAFKAGKSASMVWNLGTVAKDITEMNKNHPEWKAELVDINVGKKKFVNPYTNNGMAVNASSKNAERALMVLDLLRYDRDIFDLTFYGVKGTHWDAVSDTQYKTLASTANFPAGNVCPWGWTTTLRRTADDQPKVVNDYTNKWTKEDVIHHPLETFSFDDGKVKNEMAAINNVITQYGLPMNLGMLPDVDKALETYKQKLKEAGIDKVLTEVQTQADAYIKSQK